MCGSSRDLAEEVKAWRIREDFYYLVSAVTLLIPPLRCRKPEILTIADDLLTQDSKQFDRPKPILCKEIVGHLMEHTWPGNLMELQTAITTFVAIGDQAPILRERQLPIVQTRRSFGSSRIRFARSGRA